MPVLQGKRTAFGKMIKVFSYEKSLHGHNRELMQTVNQYLSKEKKLITEASLISYFSMISVGGPIKMFTQ